MSKLATPSAAAIRMQERAATASAQSTLAHYFAVAGVAMTGDVRYELDAFVESVIDAAVLRVKMEAAHA